MLVSSLFLIVVSSAHCNVNCKWCCAGNMGIWTMLTKRYCRSRGLSSTVCSAKSSFLMLTDPPCLLLSLGLPLAGWMLGVVVHEGPKSKVAIPTSSQNTRGASSNNRRWSTVSCSICSKVSFSQMLVTCIMMSCERLVSLAHSRLPLASAERAGVCFSWTEWVLF